jgi:hypothetical protein
LRNQHQAERQRQYSQFFKHTGLPSFCRKFEIYFKVILYNTHKFVNMNLENMHKLAEMEAHGRRVAHEQ